MATSQTQDTTKVAMQWTCVYRIYDHWLKVSGSAILSNTLVQTRQRNSILSQVYKLMPCIHIEFKHSTFVQTSIFIAGWWCCWEAFKCQAVLGDSSTLGQNVVSTSSTQNKKNAIVQIILKHTDCLRVIRDGFIYCLLTSARLFTDSGLC